MASKTGAELSTKELEEQLDGVDQTMDRLKTLYEQYFMGIQKQAPSFIHNDVERKLRDLQQLNMRNTGLRYRLATLQQKFGSYNSYWRRTLRQIENGTYVRNLAKIGRDAARSGAEIPEEILAKMPKRMREQVIKDREAAVAIARRRNQFEDDKTGESEAPMFPDLDDEAAAAINEPSVLRRELKTQGGAHVLAEDDADMDFDSFFAAFDDDAPKPAKREPASTQEITNPIPRSPQPARVPPQATQPTQAMPRVPIADPTAPTMALPRIPTGQQTGPMPTFDDGIPAQTSGIPKVPGPTTTIPKIPGPPTMGIPKIPGPATQAIPRPAPSQASRPNPIAPGSSQQTGPTPVESMNGPFPRPQTAPIQRPSQPPQAPPAQRATPPQGTPPQRPSQPAPPRNTPPAGTPRPAAPAPLRPPPGMTEADVNALHAKYVQAKQAVGEKVDASSREKLLRTINQTAPKIMEQYKASGVDFSVVVKDNQVVIKAKPKG